MKTLSRYAGFLLSVLLIFMSLKSFSQQTGPVQLGAYYFNGWTAKSDSHILNNTLTANFSERQSKWGWVTSTPDVMQQQIDLAANAGLSFFSFCWYYRNAQIYKTDPLNQALDLYMKAPNNNRLKFNLMVANHAGFILGPNDWKNLETIWIQAFKNPQYLKVNNKPYIIFFSIPTLVQSFGSTQAVKDAFNDLRAAAASAGLNGVTIGACVPGPKAIQQAEDCGIDVTTGYNYHNDGFGLSQQTQIPVGTLLKSDNNTWNTMASSVNTSIYIPVSTLNWDPRPWADDKNHYNTAPYYVGYSASSVYKSVKTLLNWINANPGKDTARIAMLYAWNEYGEGAWLTPSAAMSPLDGVKKAISK